MRNEEDFEGEFDAALLNHLKGKPEDYVRYWMKKETPLTWELIVKTAYSDVFTSCYDYLNCIWYQWSS